MFYCLVFRPYKYVEVICITQYGKTLITGLASLIISCIQGKMVAIVAPSKEKAKLSMRYYIEHIGDNPIFYEQLEKNTRLERLRQEESKERITLRNGGGIYALSVDQKNSKKTIEAAMGQGSPIVIQDESGLIEDETEATIFRMIIGKKDEDKLYAKIGNPFYSDPPNSHFKQSWEDEAYHKIFIDGNQAVKEGRMDMYELMMLRKKPLAGILIDCEFPPENLMDRDGYLKLVVSNDLKFNEQSKEQILKMIQEERKLEEQLKECSDSQQRVELRKNLNGIPITKLGADIGAGNDSNSYTIRKGNWAIKAGESKSSDVLVNVNAIIDLIDEYNIKHENVNIDDTGVGKGVTARLIELGYSVNKVEFGSKATDSETYHNLKAEIFWNAMLWIKEGGQFDMNDNWNQITWIKYKQQSGEKKIIIKDKALLRKEYGKSPDDADSFALTFYEAPYVGII